MYRSVLILLLVLPAGCSDLPWHGWPSADERDDDGQDLPSAQEVVAKGPAKRPLLPPAPSSFVAEASPASHVPRPRRPARPTRKTEEAVLLGLVWLKKHQNPDGMWSADRFMANCKRGTCTGPGAGRDRDVGVTGLALLAFLGAGHTHKHGKFKRTVKQGLKALKGRQRKDGSFGPPTRDGQRVLDHVVAAAAVCEAYGLSARTPLLRDMAQRATDFVVRCQKPYSGWGCGVRPERCDTWTTAWAVLALKCAKLSGLTVPREAFEGALSWLDKVTDETSGITASEADPAYRKVSSRRAYGPGASSFAAKPTCTAAAMFCRILMGASLRHHLLQKGSRRLLENLPLRDPKAGRIDFAYLYFGSLAAFQMGGQVWARWYRAMEGALVPTQRRDGCRYGSWEPVGPRAAEGGRVYATAMASLTLETYYRYQRFSSYR